MNLHSGPTADSSWRSDLSKISSPYLPHTTCWFSTMRSWFVTHSEILETFNSLSRLRFFFYFWSKNDYSFVSYIWLGHHYLYCHPPWSLQDRSPPHSSTQIVWNCCPWKVLHFTLHALPTNCKMYIFLQRFWLHWFSFSFCRKHLRYLTVFHVFMLVNERKSVFTCHAHVLLLQSRHVWL